MPACARPVRTLARSFFSASSVLPIFWVADCLTSAMVVSAILNSSMVADPRALVLAHHHAPERAGLEDVEHHERQTLFAAQREGGGVEHAQVFRDRFVEGQRLVALGARVLLGV